MYILLPSFIIINFQKPKQSLVITNQYFKTTF